VVSPLRSSPPQGASAEEIRRLRERMQRMTDGLPRRVLDTHPALAGVVQLRTGGSYQVDSASLAMALMAGPSATGSWCAVVGVPDFGAEAASALGVDLSRTVLVPEPGTHWLEVVAALVDVTAVVVVRPPGRVPEGIAAKLDARLRKRGAVLVSWGPWPRCEARLTTHEPRWSGLGQGHGHLRSRRLEISVHRGLRGTGTGRRFPLWFDADGGLERVPPEAVGALRAVSAREVAG